MNRLEAEARPFLTPLVVGDPVVLDQQQQQLVARWIALKCLVVEHSTGDSAVTPRSYREAFRARGEIPHYFRIYVGSHNTQHDAAMRRFAQCMAFRSLQVSPPLGGVPNNIQSITFYMGRVFVHVIAARIDNFEFERFIKIPELHKNCRIWPFQHHEIVWPKEPAFEVPGISEIAFSLETFIDSHQKIWVDGKPE